MSKVKVFVEPGEDELEVHSNLIKALTAHTNGDAHLTESFEDPAMIDISQRFENVHTTHYKKLLEEVIAALEEEYNHGDF